MTTTFIPTWDGSSMRPRIGLTRGRNSNWPIESRGQRAINLDKQDQMVRESTFGTKRMKSASRVLVPFAPTFACPALLASLARSAALIRSLAFSLMIRSSWEKSLCVRSSYIFNPLWTKTFHFKELWSEWGKKTWEWYGRGDGLERDRKNRKRQLKMKKRDRKIKEWI